MAEETTAVATGSPAAAQAALRRLALRHAAGEIDAERLAGERRSIERALGDWLLTAPTIAAEPPPAARRPAHARPSAALVTVLSVGVTVLALAGYAWKGSPSLATTLARGAAPASAQGSGGAGTAGANGSPDSSSVAQIAAMVDTLAARLKDKPDDAEGWLMLARSYVVLGRFGEALPPYRRTIELQPTNAALLADYADALIAANGKTTGESDQAIARALAIDPGQVKALALAGTADYDRGDYASAIARWQKVVDALPPGSELGQQVLASIAEARQRTGPAASAVAGTTVGVVAAGRTGPATSPAGKTVSGSVSIAPSLAAQAAPADSVFIFARSVEGSRMPLAVLRGKVSDLPIRFTLDDSMAMAPGATLSAAARVIVGARVSKSGQAMPQAGDLAGESAPVAPGASGLEITIGNVVGAR